MSNSPRIGTTPSNRKTVPVSVQYLILYGPPPWVTWARELVRSLQSNTPRPVEIQILPQTATPAQLDNFPEDETLAIIFTNKAAVSRPVSTEPSGGTFWEGLRKESRAAVYAIELTRHLRSIAIEIPTYANQEEIASAIIETVFDCSPNAEELSFRSLQSPILDETPQFDQPSLEMQSRLIGKVLEPLVAAIHGAPLESIIWPPELFLAGDAPNMPLTSIVEIAGGARILTYGPYLAAPSGTWRADITLGFSPDIQEMLFVVEVVEGPSVIYRGYFRPKEGGLFSLSFNIELTRGAKPLEIRILTLETALEGRMSLIEVVLSSLSDSNPGASQHLRD